MEETARNRPSGENRTADVLLSKYRDDSSIGRNLPLVVIMNPVSVPS